jgi:hypothetical protein
MRSREFFDRKEAGELLACDLEHDRGGGACWDSMALGIAYFLRLKNVAMHFP